MEKKRLFGIILVTPLMAVTWACATRLAKNICFENDETFKSPSMLVFVTSACLFPVFPVYLIIARKGLSTIRDYMKDEKPLRMIMKFFMFCFLSWISNYSYIRALSMRTSTDVTTLFAVNPALVSLSSWIILHEKFVVTKVIAVIISMTGVAMLAYMHKSPSKMWGALLVVFSAAISSTYKVLYVRFSTPNSKSVGSVAFFLSGVGLCSLLSSWPIPLTLALTGVEPLNNPPYGLIAGTIALAVAANLFANIGSTLTYNVAVQAGLILSIGIAVILDAYYEQLDYRPMQIGAMVLIACSFIFDACVNILFEYCNKVYCKDRNKKKQEKTEPRNVLSYR